MVTTADAEPSADLGRILRERGFWGLTILGLLFFHRPLFFGQTFFYRDLYLYFLPMRRLFAELLRAGEWPWWNPDLHGGLPFAADFSNSTFYPSQLFYLILPAERALSLEIAGHVVLSASAAYVLARVIGMRSPAAAVTGLIFGYCGFTLSQANLMVRLLAQPYLPLVVLFWHLFLVERRRRWWLASVAGGVLQILAGAPESVAFTFAVVLVWTLAVSNGGRQMRRRLALWIVLCVAVAGVAAIQLVPGFEMVGQSSRGDGLDLDVAGAHSVHPLRLPELVIPAFFGQTDRLEPGDYWGSHRVDGGFPLMLSLYVGLLPLALAALAAIRRSKPLDAWLAALFALALVLSLGRYLPFFEALYRWVPGIQVFRYPVKYFLLGLLPLALLVGRGFEIWLDERRPDRRKLVWWGVVTLGLGALAWRTFPGLAAGIQESFFGRSGGQINDGLTSSWTHIIIIWFLAAAAYQWSGWSPLKASWVLFGVIALDLMTTGKAVNPTVPDDFLREAPPAATLISENLAGGRMYRDPLPGDVPIRAPSGEISWLYRWSQEILKDFLGASFGLPVIYHGDYNGLAPRPIMRLKWTVEALPWDRRLPLLSAASARVIVTEDDLLSLPDLSLPGLERLATIDNASDVSFFAYRNHFAADPVRFVPIGHRVDDLDGAVAAMLAPGFDPRVHVVLEGFTPPPSECRDQPRIETLETSVRRKTVSIETNCAGALVFSEVHYPGWEARLDNRRVPLLRANAAFQALWLEPGSHHVELRFVPRSLYWGLMISVVSLIVAALIPWHPRRRRQEEVNQPQQ